MQDTNHGTSPIQKAQEFLFNYLLPVWTLWVIYPSYLQIQPGLDTGWMLGNLEQLRQGYVFGKDALFLNYGPLGLLSHRIEAAIHYYPFLLVWDIIYTGAAYYYLQKASKQFFPNHWHKVLLLAIAYGISFSYNSIGFVYLFIALNLITESKKLLYYSGWILLWLLPLIKTNFLPAAGFITVLLCIKYLFDKDLTRFFSAILIAGITIGLLWPFFRVDSLGYLKGVYEITKGYAQTYGKSDDSLKGHVFLFAALSSILGLLWVCLRRFNRKKLLSKPLDYYREAIALVFILLLYKSAFIRGDLEHRTLFLCYSPLPFLWLGVSGQKLEKALMIGIASASFLLVGVTKIGVNNVKGERVWASIKAIGQLPIAAPSKTENAVEPYLLQIIGSKTVDVQPVHSYAAYEHSLNYKPSNLIQAIYGYTPFLDSVSGAWYSSKSRPQFILLNADDLDTLPSPALFSGFYNSIKANYSLVNETRNWLLFEKKTTFHSTKFQKLRDVDWATNQWISIPDSLQKNSLWVLKSESSGLVNLFKSHSAFRMKIQTLSGTFNYRMTQGLLEKGFIPAAFRKDVQSLRSFMLGSDSCLANKMNIEGEGLPPSMQFAVYAVK